MPDRTQPASLPIAFVVLNLLVIANIAMAIAIAVLLVILPSQQWIMTSLDLSPGPEADRIILGLRAIAAIGIVLCVLTHFILKHMLAIIGTVRVGDPFVSANARRLNRIAWLILAIQMLGIGVAIIVRLIDSTAHPIDIDASVPIAGWVAVLFAFVLARVFAEGAAMRDDLRATI